MKHRNLWIPLWQIKFPVFFGFNSKVQALTWIWLRKENHLFNDVTSAAVTDLFIFIKIFSIKLKKLKILKRFDANFRFDCWNTKQFYSIDLCIIWWNWLKNKINSERWMCNRTDWNFKGLQFIFFQHLFVLLFNIFTWNFCFNIIKCVIQTEFIFFYIFGK